MTNIKNKVKIYHIMYMDKPVTDVVMSTDNLVESITKFVPDSPMQPIWGNTDNMSKQALTSKFFTFIKDRCYEDNRADLPVILKSAGLTSNNPYEWIKITHGVTYEDFFWIKFDKENINWNNVRIR